MPARSDSPRALIRYALAGIVVTMAIAWMLYLVRDALLLIYIATLVATGLAPQVARIERRPIAGRQLPRWLSILIIYLVFVGMLVGISVLIVPPLIEQARGLWNALPEMSRQGQQWLIDRGLLSRELTFREAVEQAPGRGGDAVNTVVGAIWSFFGGIFGLVAILILAFYFLLDADRMVAAFLRLFPRGNQARAADACVRVTTKVSAWLGGQLLLAAVIGGTAAIGLGLMGVPYFYVLALLAGLGEMIPIVGPILAAIPAVVVALTVSPTLALGVGIFFLVQQQIENHLLVPKIMERQVGVSAVVVIIALLVGGSLLGVVGAILAVPTAAVLQVLFEELVPEAGVE